MIIGILGTRGIPNHHGGFEQFAEHFSVYLSEIGHDVYVYNSSAHPYTNKSFKGVNIVTCWDPEEKTGTIGQFIYDFNCIIDSRKRKFDIILQLGYTSSSIWHWLLPKSPLIITNMDGLEWKRSKYSRRVQKFLKYAERLAVNSSDFLVSDSKGIKNYLEKEYHVESQYIPYGADLFDKPKSNALEPYNLKSYDYNMLVARLEPENNIEVILDGVASSNKKSPFLVIGKHDVNSYGKYLKDKFKDQNNIIFVGGIYDMEKLNNLRFYANLYFHGHSVGGTNPSLLEAMASKSLIVAHNNEFNKSILKDNAFYFDTKEDVIQHLETRSKQNERDKVEACFVEIEQNYSWQKINKEYLDYFYGCMA